MVKSELKRWIKNFYSGRDNPYQEIFLDGRKVVTGYRKDALKRIAEVREEDLKGKRILDIACENGHTSMLAAERGARVVGFDRDTPLIGYANKVSADLGLDCEFFEHDLEWGPFAYGRFDTIFCFAIFNWAPQDALLRTLRYAGGILYFEGHCSTKELREEYHYCDFVLRHYDVEFLGWHEGDCNCNEGERRIFLRCAPKS